METYQTVRKCQQQRGAVPIDRLGWRNNELQLFPARFRGNYKFTVDKDGHVQQIVTRDWDVNMVRLQPSATKLKSEKKDAKTAQHPQPAFDEWENAAMR